MILPFLHQTKKLLSDVSSFGIGGPARYFTEAHSAAEMQAVLKFAHEKNIRVFILGKGSNSLFHDKGFDGLVVLNKIDYLQMTDSIVRVGSGYSFARLGGITARSGLTGLEFASGIPATVGGAIYMNAGANGKETAESLVAVNYIFEDGESVFLNKNDIFFGYRISSFQQWKGAIVDATFKLKHAHDAKLVQKKILSYRLKTQPYGEKSAGCIFKNPPEIPAGKLIEQCGLKGTKIGGAAISELHGNFIVNQGRAKAQDVLDLIFKVKEKIYRNTGIVLEEEIHIVPYTISHE
jgi:UDP-N-acetylmuramate dehydrogenase